MNSMEIQSIALSAGSIISIFALLTSIWSINISKKTYVDMAKSTIIDKEYNTFHELLKIQIDYPMVSHLFEVPENYNSTLILVKNYIKIDSIDKSHFLLIERATAEMVFDLFETTIYRYEHAKAWNDIYRQDFLKEMLGYFTKRLLINQRLLYYWHNSGGNLSAFYETKTQLYYSRYLVITQDNIKKTMDKVGPF